MTTPTSYDAFLASKERRFTGCGFEASGFSPVLHPHQRDGARWGLKKGRAAFFWACGLGKTLAQLEFARHVVDYTGGRVIIFAPLCVAEQTIDEARNLLGMSVGLYGDGESVEIVNYEMIHHVNAADWAGVVLDESSILKSVDGKTRTLLIEKFRDTRFRLACTATPWPNDPAEIGNHAEFLGVMSRAEMLSSYFINRGEGNRSWDLKGHARESFFKWLASWAMFLQKPSDLGYSDNGFELPPLDIRAELVPTDIVTPGRLFADKLKGVTDRAATRRATASARVTRVVTVALQSQGQGIIWCGLNDEQDAVSDGLGEACVSVSGSMDIAHKRNAVHRFLAGDVRFLVTKVDIVGFGMNFQCAPLQIFVGLGDSYEKYYQAIRRSWRYGQKSMVRVVVVLSDIEEEILLNVKRKERMASAMQDQMIGRITEFEKAEIAERSTVAPYSEVVERGQLWESWRGDCIEVMERIAPRTVGLAVFSPPFAQLYTYSASDRDLGNCATVEKFLEHFSFVARELLRVMRPGRIVAMHCQQLGLQLARDGVIGRVDLRGKLIAVAQAEGFIYHGEVTIDKNPQAQAIRTKAKSLLFVQLRKDSSWMSPAMADYIVLLRAPGVNEIPVIPDCTNEEWIEWAHPNWYGISESDTLQVAEAREEEDEKHICALQLPTIRRCVRLWSNPGDVVLDPFSGIGSTGYEAVKAGRRAVLAELKENYWRTGLKNLRAAERESLSRTLFADQDEDVA